MSAPRPGRDRQPGPPHRGDGGYPARRPPRLDAPPGPDLTPAPWICLSAALGEELSLNRTTREQWKQSAGGYVTADYADAPLDYWKSLERRPALITTTIYDITGHAATSFRSWAHDNISQYR